MLNKTLIILLIWSNLLNAYYVENNNSIFKVSNNARINSIGGLHILSNEISGVFNQPIALNNNIKGNSYYSYLKYFDNIINVHQLGFCVLDNPKKNISLGLIKRSIDDIYNTKVAWKYHENGPQFNEIDYSKINAFKDSEIGLLISYSYQPKQDIILNFKFKPTFHSVYSRKAWGASFDAILVKKINKFNITLGIEDLISYKKWEMGTLEQYYVSSYANLSYSYNSLLVAIEKNNKTKLRYGIEYTFSNIFKIRCGLNEFDYFSYGLGIENEIFNFNFAYLKTENNINDYISQYSLIIKLNGIRKMYDDLNI